MFPRPEPGVPASPSVPPSILESVPKNAELLRTEHIQLLDEKFGHLIVPYRKLHISHLSNFNFETIRQKMVEEGGVSNEVMEAYLTLKRLTWGPLKRH